MRLYYYDERTPENYQPPFFAQGDEYGFSYAEKPLKINVGKVDTPYHSLDQEPHNPWHPLISNSVDMKIQTTYESFEVPDENTATQPLNTCGFLDDDEDDPVEYGEVRDVELLQKMADVSMLDVSVYTQNLPPLIPCVSAATGPRRSRLRKVSIGSRLFR